MKTGSSNLVRISFFSSGARPADYFFFGGALWAALAMTLWVGVLAGGWEFTATYGAVAWHAHEFLFGYVGAVVAGFLLTAVPNWTRRLPVGGAPLLVLFLLWVAGRAGLLAVDYIGVVPAAIVDSLFLVTLAVVILREILAGRNWRNVKTVVLVSLLAAADIAFHTEAILAGAPHYSVRVSIALIISLIMLIGGRIVPSFTRNWLVRSGAARLPAPYGRFDTLSVVIAAVALVIWVGIPGSSRTGVALLVAGAIQLLRLSRWAGLASWREPLILVLHAGYAFIPLGFLLVGASVLWPDRVPATGALHAWTAGAMTLMTLAVMTRTTLGHAGQKLEAGRATQFIYAAATVAAVARFLAPFAGNFDSEFLYAAAVAWVAAFGGFVLCYGPMLLRNDRL